MRVGVLTKKMGMTRLYLDDRSHCPVTVLKLDNCQVVGHRTKTKDGYDALQLGFGSRKIKNINKPQLEFYSKSKIEPKSKIVEFRVTKENFLKIGTKILPSHFAIGQYVDVSSNSIGKGFAGAMKRHNFSGLRASHGVSVSHRSHGSTGNSQDPGRVWKGKKMAGHMGSSKVTIQNLEVVSVDDDRGLILVKGGVPGAKGSSVVLNDAKKKNTPIINAIETEQNESNQNQINNESVDKNEQIKTVKNEKKSDENQSNNVSKKEENIKLETETQKSLESKKEQNES